MTTDWTRGYVADLEYSQGFYGDLAPNHIDLVCLINGVVPPRRTEGFTYCELGSGLGLTATALAAVNPDGEFYAVDFNPAHTARADDLGAEGRLDNITYIEESFEVLADGDGPDLPMFDYVTLHGVWSWISPELREAIVRFLARKLKPGGAVLVSYNALPGWTGAIPVQYLLSELGAEAQGRSDHRLVAAFNKIGQMVDAGCPYLKDNPTIDRVGKFIGNQDLAYLVHEYFNQNWSPQFHSAVAEDMAGAKLGYVGSATLPYNYADLILNEGQRKFRDTVENPALRETISDFFSGRSFRSDIFVRGKRLMEAAERDTRLRALEIGPLVPRDLMKLEIDVPAGKATLNEPVYGRMLDRLAEGPQTIDTLLGLPDLPAGTRVSATEVAGLLVAVRAGLPTRRGPRVAAPVPLNSYLGRRALSQPAKGTSAIAVPGLGTAMSVPVAEAGTLGLVTSLGTTDPRRLAEGLWEPIHRRGEAIVKDGQKIEDPEENIRILQEQVETILKNRLEMWRMHGVVPASVA